MGLAISSTIERLSSSQFRKSRNILSLLWEMIILGDYNLSRDDFLFSEGGACMQRDIRDIYFAVEPLPSKKTRGGGEFIISQNDF